MVISIMGSVMILLLFLVILQYSLEEKSSKEYCKMTSIESGFDKMAYSSNFSVPFFMLAILYVLFDMELVILFPLLFLVNFTFWSAYASLLLIVLVVITLLMEWFYTGLKWMAYNILIWF